MIRRIRLHHPTVSTDPPARNESSMIPFIDPLHFGTAFRMLTFLRITKYFVTQMKGTGMKYLLLVVLLMAVIITSGCLSGGNLKVINLDVKLEDLGDYGQAWYFNFDVQNTGSVTENAGFSQLEWYPKVLAYHKNGEFICSDWQLGRTLEPKEKTHYFLACMGKERVTSIADANIEVKIMRGS